MKTISTLILAACLLVSCSATKHLPAKTADKATPVVQAPNDGSSFDKAIVIQEKSEKTGIDAEYGWLRQNYPGYKTKGQSLSNHDKKPYDVITIILADKTEKSIYFDISNFFGKF